MLTGYVIDATTLTMTNHNRTLANMPHMMTLCILLPVSTVYHYLIVPQHCQNLPEENEVELDQRETAKNSEH